MADKNVSIDITAQDRTKAAFDSVKRNLGDVGGAVKGVVSGFAAFAAAAGIGQLVSQAVQAASAAEQSSNRLNAVLRATGNVSGYTRDQLDGMADALTRVTTFDDEGIRDAQSTLLKFGNLHGEVFERALKVSADYAAFTGTEMEAAAQLIGRALADPIRGVSMLERQVGALTAAQKDSIQTFIEQGKIAEAQAIVFEKLEGSIGGTAGTMNSGIYGATTAAKKAFDDLMEAMGRAGPTKIIVENSLLSMASVMDFLRKAIEDANKEVERSIFFQGQLKPLPPDAGGRAPRSELEGMSEEEVQSKLAAWDAQDAASRAAIAEAQAKKAIELAKAQAKAREQEMKDTELMAKMIQESAAEQEQSMAQTMQNQAEHNAEKMRLELAWQQMIDESAAQQQAAIGETMLLMEEAEAAKAEAAQRSYLRLMESLTSERGLLEQDYADKMLVLKQWVLDRDAELVKMHEKGVLDEFEFNQQRFANNAQYYAQAKAIDVRYQADKTRIEDDAIKKRFAIANVYRKADINSAAFFAGQMTNLMQTNSRKLFELGKAGAIAGAVIDTYKAATGAYAALASIPFVGPFLGAAAAAAAIAVGMARVSAIRSQQFGSGGGGAVGTYSASPNTGLPEPSGPGFQEAPQSPIVQAQAPVRRDINVTIQGEGVFTAETIRDKLIPLLNDAIGDGVVLKVV